MGSRQSVTKMIRISITLVLNQHTHPYRKWGDISPLLPTIGRFFRKYFELLPSNWYFPFLSECYLVVWGWGLHILRLIIYRWVRYNNTKDVKFRCNMAWSELQALISLIRKKRKLKLIMENEKQQHQTKGTFAHQILTK